jgi:hypothetical protein
VGVNNRARRAAKKRKRGASARGRVEGDGEGLFGAYAPDYPFDTPGADDPSVADLLIAESIGLIEMGQAAEDLARRLRADSCAVRPALIVRAMKRHVQKATAYAVRAGWTPHDLSELVRRRLTPAHQPLLAHLLHEQAEGHPPERVAPQWRDEIAAIGPRPGDTRLETQERLALALGLSSVLGAVPLIPRLIPPPGEADPLAAAQQRVAPGGQDAKVLARVRGLLAKAESTEFPDEAEALSTKAQQLISRYSLDRLLAVSDQRDSTGEAAIVSRRLWIDAPYVGAKANLVHQVAVANRCSSVVAEKLGFTTVVGTASDLDGVEMLTTSLMVQADTAMLAAGRQTSRGGARSPSFRRSFLLAYATRIGQRLSEADETAVTAAAESDSSGALVPLLRGQAEQVDEALAKMFPHTVRRRASVGNWQGWIEGMAAADQAELRAHRRIAG